ncbi:MAG: TolC family protein [Candidatus Margulisiibacteriota bacterium]
MRIKLGAIALLLASPLMAQPKTMPLQSYLQEVQRQNKTIVGAKLAIEAAALKQKESNLSTTPVFYSNGQALSDSKLGPMTTFTGEQTLAYSVDAGVSTQLSMGTQLKAGYSLAYTSLVGANPFFVSQTAYYDAKPMIEITHPLWRGAGGSLIGANKRVIMAQANAQQLSNQYVVTQVLNQAEAVYWRLALAQQAVKIYKDGVARAQKMSDWVSRRNALELGDRSDALQAQANVELRRLELQTAEDELRGAKRAFNAYRNASEGTATETLDFPSDDALMAMAQPVKPQLRDDLKAAYAGLEATSANVEINRQRLTPVLDAFASVALNQHYPTLTEAATSTLSTRYPTGMIGLKFSTSLDGPLVDDILKGAVKDYESAKATLQQRQFDQDQEWVDWTQKLGDAKKRLNIVAHIEKTQYSKWQYEVEKHQKGRSTLYQVLLFEQDYALAQLNRLRAESDVIAAYVQLKRFGS